MKSEKERHKWDADVVSYFFFVYIIRKLYTDIFLTIFQHEEYEDSAGNVVNKRTYEDLKRQGLL